MKLEQRRNLLTLRRGVPHFESDEHEFETRFQWCVEALVIKALNAILVHPTTRVTKPSKVQ